MGIGKVAAIDPDFPADPTERDRGLVLPFCDRRMGGNARMRLKN
jgi:hypothetical protein